MEGQPTATFELVTPHQRYRQSYLNYILELGDEERYPFTLDFPHEDFDQLLSQLENFRLGINIPDGYVQAHTFWLVQDDEIIGVANLRPNLTPALAEIGGHIGIGTRPAYRQRGLGILLLNQTLEQARQMGMEEIHIHCYANNQPSNATIQTCGGKLVDSVEASGAQVNRYKIHL